MADATDILDLADRQYEALAAVRDNEKFSKTKVETWELDYCRLASPVIDVR